MPLYGFDCMDVLGFQTWQAYSKIGLTRALKAIFTPDGFLYPKVRRTNPSTRFALAHIVFMWQSQDKVDCNQIPRCLCCSTVDKASLSNSYCWVNGSFFLDMWRTLHFSFFSVTNHFWHLSWTLDKPLCNWSESNNVIIL